jgi:hypothetical protein
MKFDGNQAWNDAMRAMSANREVLLVMAGVFFFLPGLIAAFFLSGIQSEMSASAAAVMAAPKNPAAMQQMLHVYGKIAPYVLLLVQMLGYLAMLALLTDRRRPTVAEAMAIGARCLPPLIGAIIVFFLGYMLASLPLGLIVIVFVMALGPQLGGAIGVSIDILVMFLLVTRLSLTLPAIVIEGIHNPVAALVRSWRMTTGRSLRLLAFYVLLLVAYSVMTIALMALINLVTAAIGTGAGVTLITAGVSGLIGAVTSIVLTAILAAVHRQLAGPSLAAISETFH